MSRDLMSSVRSSSTQHARCDRRAQKPHRSREKIRPAARGCRGPFTLCAASPVVPLGSCTPSIVSCRCRAWNAILPGVALEDTLRTMIDGRAGTWGVYARHLDTGETVAIRADEVMPAQSSVKVCVLLAYTKRIRLGNDERDRRVTLLSEDHEIGSGVLRYLAPGLSPTLDDLAWLMIVLSDNIATRALIRELGGREIVNAEMDALGVPQLRLHDSLQQGASYFTATPHDLAEVYTHLDEHAREILYRVEKVDFLPRRIPHVPAAIDHGLTAPVRVYGKAGWGARECVDAGLFETDECSWVIAAMAKDLPGLWQQTDDEGPRTLADIGETIYHAWRQ